MKDRDKQEAHLLQGRLLRLALEPSCHGLVKQNVVICGVIQRPLLLDTFL